jgi:hypothetical protein
MQVVKSVGRLVRRIKSQNRDSGRDKDKGAKLVWRISAAAPLGEYVQAPGPAPSTAAGAHVESSAAGALPTESGAPEVTERGWHDSSHDLARGTEVRETLAGSLSDELFDLLFKQKP